MKRETLKELGLSDDQVESVIGLYGKSVSRLQERIERLESTEKELTEQVNKRDEDLKTLQKNYSDNKELKQQIKDLQKENADTQRQWEEKLTGIQRDSALKQLLTESKAKNVKAVQALLDHDQITFKDGHLSGADEQIVSLKKSDPYLFDLGEKQSGYQPNGGQASSYDKTFEEAIEAGEVDQFLENQIKQKEE